MEATEEILGWEEIEETASHIRDRTGCRPTVMIITGSGLGGLADDIEEPSSLPYEDIPHFSTTSVVGHAGELVVGKVGDREVALMRGRVHFYEGHSLRRVTFPIRVLHRLGAEILIVTNAAGGLRESFTAGDLMLITDHINLVGLAGFNPLRGPNDERLGPRFVDMSSAYDVSLRELALVVAGELGIKLRQGIYVMSAGPTFETPADVRFLRLIGADVVGMSTVPEVVVARHEGMRVLGLSHISNVIPGADASQKEEHSEEEGLHQEVLEAGSKVTPKLSLLISSIIRRLEEV
jgi:purine-nucleoside phosphorylase